MTASIEFLLIRRTAQSKGGNPKQPPGGVPQYTGQDIQMIASCVRSLPAYYAAAAKAEGDELASIKLLEAAQILSRMEWQRNYRNYDTRHTLNELARVAEVAVIKFLNPCDDQGKPRTEEWEAMYIGVAWRTWRQNYKHHQAYIEQKLDDFYKSAQDDIHRFLTIGLTPVEMSARNGVV
jgi:hypothetical protein